MAGLAVVVDLSETISGRCSGRRGLPVWWNGPPRAGAAVAWVPSVAIVQCWGSPGHFLPA